MAQPQVFRFLHGLSFLVILALPILPIGYLVVRHWQGMEALFPPGSLAQAHEGLACQQCHVEPWRGWHKVLGRDPQAGFTMYRACAQCHGGLLNEQAPNPKKGTVPLSSKGESPFSCFPPVDLRHRSVMRPQVVAPHHPCQVPGEVGNCSDCHQDHQGDKGLLHVTEDQCRRCHRDLQTVDGRHTFYPNLTAFDTDHPPFGWWREGGLRDPAALRFNHQIHLCLDGKVLHGLDGAVRRLKRQECGFCHQPDFSGGRMAPVRYDKHCSECHPLAVQIVAETNDLGLQQAANAFCQEPAPHVAPELVLAILRERLRLLAQQNPMICMDGRPSEPIRRLPGQRPAEPALRELSGWVDYQASVLQRLLLEAPGGCRYCHIARRERDHAPARGLPDFELTNVPVSWFPHARFSHAKHNLMPCSACHEKAWTSTRTEDVLIPLQSKCVECHNNQQDSRMRARADCLECHRYHGSAAEPTGSMTMTRRE